MVPHRYRWFPRAVTPRRANVIVNLIPEPLTEVVVPALDDFFTRLPGPAHRVSVADAGHNSYADCRASPDCCRSIHKA
jgi:hypothetical protein